MALEIVYVYDEGCYGYIVQRNAYWAWIKYAKDGNEYEVQILNDDYDIIREGDDEFDSDDE